MSKIDDVTISVVVAKYGRDEFESILSSIEFKITIIDKDLNQNDNIREINKLDQGDMIFRLFTKLCPLHTLTQFKLYDVMKYLEYLRRY